MDQELELIRDHQAKDDDRWSHGAKQDESNDVDEDEEANAYEAKRQKTLEENLAELKSLGIDVVKRFQRNASSASDADSQRKTPRRRRKRLVDTSKLRRSNRSRTQRKLFSEEDFTMMGSNSIEKRVAECSVEVSLLNDTMIDRLISEAYIKSRIEYKKQRAQQEELRKQMEEEMEMEHIQEMEQERRHRREQVENIDKELERLEFDADDQSQGLEKLTPEEDKPKDIDVQWQQAGALPSPPTQQSKMEDEKERRKEALERRRKKRKLLAEKEYEYLHVPKGERCVISWVLRWKTVIQERKPRGRKPKKKKYQKRNKTNRSKTKDALEHGNRTEDTSKADTEGSVLVSGESSQSLIDNRIENATAEQEEDEEGREVDSDDQIKDDDDDDDERNRQYNPVEEDEVITNIDDGVILQDDCEDVDSTEMGTGSAHRSSSQHVQFPTVEYPTLHQQWPTHTFSHSLFLNQPYSIASPSVPMFHPHFMYPSIVHSYQTPFLIFQGSASQPLQAAMSFPLDAHAHEHARPLTRTDRDQMDNQLASVTRTSTGSSTVSYESNRTSSTNSRSLSARRNVPNSSDMDEPPNSQNRDELHLDGQHDTKFDADNTESGKHVSIQDEKSEEQETPQTFETRENQSVPTPICSEPTQKQIGSSRTGVGLLNSMAIDGIDFSDCPFLFEESDSESDNEDEEMSCKVVPKKRWKTFIERKDFYAALVQPHRSTREHIYNITDLVEKQAEPEDEGGEKMREEFEVVMLDDCVPMLRGRLYWTVPMWLLPGLYTIELGSPSLNACAASSTFRVTEAFGQIDPTTVGVWCVCKAVHTASNIQGEWVQCSCCHSWQHWKCYEFLPRRNQRKYLCRAKERLALIQQSGDTSLRRIWSEERIAKVEASMNSKEGFLLQVEEMENRLLGHPLKNIRPPTEDDFFCWMCYQYDKHESEEKIVFGDDSDFEILTSEMVLALLTRRIKRIIAMINKASGGYSRRILGTTENGTPIKRLYNTPNHAVCFLGTLIKKLIRDNEALRCADLGAGIGQLAAVMPDNTICVEIEKDRFEQGRERMPRHEWINTDVLSQSFYEKHYGAFDVVVSNPDFEVALSFIIVSLYLLRKSNPNARLIFLLPSDFFEASALRSRIFKLMDFKIETEYKLGHLTYLEDNPMSQKLTVDSLFIIRQGREQKYEHRVVNARLGGML